MSFISPLILLPTDQYYRQDGAFAVLIVDKATAMDPDNTVCPVCTLYLRPGITLKSHLSSHPKQKVIEALVRLSNPDKDNKHVASTSSWSEGAPPPPPNFAPVPGNHSFIYQQFMSTSSPQANVLNVNPLAQQYVTIPTVFSPQMMCPPYVYHQQQQVIMSSSGRACLPIEMPPEPPTVINLPDVDKEEEKSEKTSDFEAKDDELIKDDDQDDCNSSPRSDWSVRVRTDLSKACQTFGNAGSYSPPPSPQTTDIECIEETLYVQAETENQQAEFYYDEAQENQVESGETEAVFVPNTAAATQQINFVDVEEMQIMLSGDFMNGQLISQVCNIGGSSIRVSMLIVTIHNTAT